MGSGIESRPQNKPQQKNTSAQVHAHQHAHPSATWQSSTCCVWRTMRPLQRYTAHTPAAVLNIGSMGHPHLQTRTVCVYSRYILLPCPRPCPYPSHRDRPHSTAWQLCRRWRQPAAGRPPGAQQLQNGRLLLWRDARRHCVLHAGGTGNRSTCGSVHVRARG